MDEQEVIRTPHVPAGGDPADPARELSVTSGDVPTPEDALGFEPYVTAITEFLLNRQTRPPLTLSVEGEWGTGKSSFMRQLEARIQELAATDGRSSARTVWFNAWRHDKEEALWAAFALEFVQKLADQVGPLRRLAAAGKLLWMRYRWREGGADFARAVGSGAVYLVVSLAAIILAGILGFQRIAQIQNDQLLQTTLRVALAAVLSSGVVGYAALLFSVLGKIRHHLGNPFAIDLKKHVRAPDYESKVAFIEQFHEDFAKIVTAYAGEDKVIVFVDDLDRCEVPKAADLMQALNLMTSVQEQQNLVFIIGMDRERVAASLAVKHEKILPYMARRATVRSDQAGAPPGPLSGLEYGYEFIEKFVQLPLGVPRPSRRNVRDYLNRILVLTDAGMTDEVDSSDAVAANHLESGGAPAPGQPTETKSGAPGGPHGTDSAAPEGGSLTHRARQEGKRAAVTDRPLVRRLGEMVAPALDDNPRRIKQFVNLFRLRAFIAVATGLFDAPGGGGPTPEQLAKFVAILIRWPVLLTDLDAYPRLLAGLHQVATNRTLLAELRKPAVSGGIGVDLSGVEAGDPLYDPDFRSVVLQWSRRGELLALLRAGCLDADGVLIPAAEAVYGVAALQVEKLLEVSPRVQRAVPEPLGPSTGPPAESPVEENVQPAVDPRSAPRPGYDRVQDALEQFYRAMSFSPDGGVHCLIFRKDVHDQLVEVAAVPGRSDQQALAVPLEDGQGLLGRALVTGSVQYVRGRTPTSDADLIGPQSLTRLEARLLGIQAGYLAMPLGGAASDAVLVCVSSEPETLADSATMTRAHQLVSALLAPSFRSEPDQPSPAIQPPDRTETSLSTADQSIPR